MLGVTQSALSKNIRRLESEIGITLFDRSRRPVSLTPEAQVLRDEAETVLLTFEKTLMHRSPTSQKLCRQSSSAARIMSIVFAHAGRILLRTVRYSDNCF